MSTQPAVRTVCAWCKALIHDGVLVDGRESSGICPACSVKVRAQYGLPARKEAK